MNLSFSGGSYGGDNSKLEDDSILECKICWHVYDPSEGDEYWQIETTIEPEVIDEIDHWIRGL